MATGDPAPGRSRPAARALAAVTTCTLAVALFASSKPQGAELCAHVIAEIENLAAKGQLLGDLAPAFESHAR